ncbi:hypothetical protein ACNOYE_03870 [Nannocystaceae bacterium ST9]
MITTTTTIILGYALMLAPPPSPCDGGGCRIAVEMNGNSLNCVAIGAETAVSIDLSDGVPLTGLQVSATLDGQPQTATGTGTTFEAKAGKWTVELSLGDQKCTEEFKLAKPENDPPPPSQPMRDAARVATKARKWLVEDQNIAGHVGLRTKREKKSKKREKKSKSVVPAWSRRITLYFLPDGTPAFPIPADLEETDIITIAVVVPVGSVIEVEDTSCPELVLGRVRGLEDEQGLIDESSGTEQNPNTKPDEFEIREFGEFQCSDALGIELEGSLANETDTHTIDVKREHELPLDKVYFLTVGAGVVFDLSRPTRVSLHERPISGMGGQTEQVISQSRDFSGMRPVVTVGAHLCGANPNHWRPCDLFSPTLVLDPLRIDDGFGFGLNLTTPWFGILVAGSMYKSQVLDDNLGVGVGDVWTLPGALPTRERFDANSFGLMVGLTVTTDLYRRIAAKVKK